MRLPTSDPDRSTTRFMRRVLAMTALFATLPGCPTPLPVATHWIGINEVPGCVAPDACPCPKTSNPKDWEASRLLRFEPEGAMGPVELPRNLMKYCLYEWKHRAAPTAPPDPDPTLVTDPAYRARYVDVPDRGAALTPFVRSFAQDGVLIARHENEMSGTTDVAQKFPHRKARKTIDGKIIDALAGVQNKTETTTWSNLLPLLLAWAGFGLFTIACGVE